MSYGIDISFHKAENKLEAFELAQAAMKEIADNAQDYMKDTMCYSPLVRMAKKEPEYDSTLWDKYDASVHLANRLWIRNVFNFRFMWWPEYKLLGVISRSEYLKNLGWKEVYFQNSTDQDYPYTEWENICEMFDEKVKQAQAVSTESICAAMDEYEKKEYVTPEEIEEHCEYHRRWKAYTDIFDALAINSILYENGKSDKYEYFAMNAVPDSDAYLYLEIASRGFAKHYPDI